MPDLKKILTHAWGALALGAAVIGTFLPVRTEAQTNQPQALPSIALTAGMYNIVAQVAQTPSQREIGLMYRQSMPTHQGMLFVFEAPAIQCFWMKNTLLPLSIAFIADDGRIVNIAEMQANTLTSHCSSKPVRYALEMNQGWFAKRGIQAGNQLSGPPFRSPRR